MLLGALIDLGVPLDVIGDALDAIGAGRQRLTITKIVKHGIAAADVKVDTHGHILDAQQQVHAHHGPSAVAAAAASTGSGPQHVRPATPPPHRHPRAGTEGSGKFVAIKFRAETHERHVHVDELGDKVEQVHEHASGPVAAPHAHYLYADIRWRIARAPLAEGTRARALDIFDRLARAEAKLHGTTIDEVQFHEVGAIDSIVDVVGTAAALDWLSPASVTCAAIAMGHGTLHSAHGTLPVPAPAALEPRASWSTAAYRASSARPRAPRSSRMPSPRGRHRRRAARSSSAGARATSISPIGRTSCARPSSSARTS
jgi:uncharacterized protein (DUF111 family)